MKYKEHKIIEVEEGSIAQELEIESGDTLLWINEESIQDVFDYRYLVADEAIDVCIRKANGEEWILEIDKEYGEDLGLVFETSLMDELIRCRNKCKFCFIDQLPPNMRETVYFKDDDWRMSFLNGNYITLTNMSETDIERLIKYRLSPLNISIHATDEKVRVDLLGNRFAGKILSQIRRLVDAGIQINGQIVLCKGLNDGQVLDQTVRDLSQFIPDILSLTVVPVGISRFREGLAKLEGFDKEAAGEVVEVVEKWQKYYLEKMGTRFIFAADEFYVTGEKPLLTYEEYENFPVLDNGVGMLTKFKYELIKGLEEIIPDPTLDFECSLVTGCITEDFIKECVALTKEKFPNLTIHVYPVVNHFFGENITVTGLLTGSDIISTLKQSVPLGKVLLLAENMLKNGEPILLDDYTVEQIAKELQIPIEIVPNEGREWVQKIIDIKEKIQMSKPIVAVIGRPNVGKSTLFNRLTKSKTSIVDDTPGVTRDRIYGDVEWLRYKFTLIDTGGIEPESTDIILNQMRRQAEAAIESADVILFLVDVKTGMTDADTHVANMLRKSHKPVVLVVNKVDDMVHQTMGMYEFYNLGLGEPIPISSGQALNLGDMLDEIVKYFPDGAEEQEEDEKIRVAIIGKPNVGKSSLVNKIVGEERVIVSDIAGTTRDSVDTEVKIDGQDYVLIDTAGMRKRSKIKESIEKYSIIRTIAAVDRADIVLIMIDAEEGITEQDTKIAGMAHEAGKGCIVVVNKWDAVEKDDKTMNKYLKNITNTLAYMQYAPCMFISALTGQRIPKLFEMIYTISQNQTRRISTGVLNDVLYEAMAMNQPPSDKGKPLKIFYMTQVSVKPPTFVIFVNDKELMHFSYQRYIENQMREAFGFKGTPLRFIVREKGAKE